MNSVSASRPPARWAMFVRVLLGMVFAPMALADECIPIEFQQITASDPHPFDQLGSSVASSGDWVAVGARSGDADDVSNCGAVYVFRRDDMGTPEDAADDLWVEHTKLTASDAASNDNFGGAVGLDGDWLVTGARFDDDAGPNTGAVYVFRRTDNGTPDDLSDDGWTEQVKLLAGDANEGDEFVIAVDIDSDRIVVGAWRNDLAAELGGAAYVFVRDDAGTPNDNSDDTWIQQDQLVASDADPIDELGFSVGIDGPWIVGGSPFEDHAGEASGAVYVYLLDDNGTPNDPFDDVWNETQKLIPPNGAENDVFGSALAIAGDWVAVGAPFADGPVASNVGEVHLYRRDDNGTPGDFADDVWGLVDPVAFSDMASGDEIGASLALSGTRLFVGAPGHDMPTLNGGAVYWLELNDVWAERRKLTATDGQPGAGFGRASAINATRAFVGARLHSTTESSAGAVYVYALEADIDGPVVVHGVGLPGETRPFSGFVDPRAESSDGMQFDLGLQEVSIVFSEIVEAVGGGPVSTDSFVVTSTGEVAPAIESVDASANPLIVIHITSPPPLQEWTTITAHVQDACGNVTPDLGDFGPGALEPDRVDWLFLPGDVDQSGSVGPFDLLRFRQFINGDFSPEFGMTADYVDMDRNAEVTPFDLLRYRLLINGDAPSTQSWAGETANHPQP